VAARISSFSLQSHYPALHYWKRVSDVTSSRTVLGISTKHATNAISLCVRLPKLPHSGPPSHFLRLGLNNAVRGMTVIEVTSGYGSECRSCHCSLMNQGNIQRLRSSQSNMLLVVMVTRLFDGPECDCIPYTAGAHSQPKVGSAVTALLGLKLS